MTEHSKRLVKKLWSYCNVLRDDGLSYQDSLEQLTFLLFLKMADEREPVRDFTVDVDGRPTPILEAPLKASKMAENVNDPELSEYLVPIKWIKTVDREQAYWEKGLFAVQDTACRLRNQFTIERLVHHFELED